MSAPALPPSEEFRPVATWKDEATGAVVMLAVLVLLMWFLLGWLFSALGVPAGGWVALVAALGVAAAMFQHRKKQYFAAAGLEVLVVSPEGLELRQRYRRTQLRWADITELGPGTVDLGYRTPGSTARRVHAIAEAVAATQVAAYGPTAVELAPDIPALQRANHEQKAREQRSHVNLSLYSADFPAGRLGDWFRAHRPDLLA